MAASYAGAPPNDVFPAVSSALVGAGDAAWLPTDDFNGVVRTAADVGAYAFDPAGNPGWTIQAGFKELVATDTDSDTDTDADSDTDTDADSDADSDPGSTPTGGPKGDDGCSCGGHGGGSWMGVVLLLLARYRVRTSSLTTGR